MSFSLSQRPAAPGFTRVGKVIACSTWASEIPRFCIRRRAWRSYSICMTELYGGAIAVAIGKSLLVLHRDDDVLGQPVPLRPLDKAADQLAVADPEGVGLSA